MRRTLIVIQLCVSLVVLLGPTDRGRGRAGAEDAPDARLAEEIVRAPAPLQDHELYPHFLRAASAEEVQQACGHSNHGIAISAAWEIVRRSVPKVPEGEHAPLDSRVLHRFLGFVDGRIRHRPPTAFEDAVLSATATDQGLIYFTSRSALKLFSAEDGGIPSLNAAARREGKALHVKCGDFVWRVAYPGKENSSSIYDVDSATLLVDGDTVYLATPFDRGSAFYLYAVDRESRKVQWASDVRGDGGLVTYSGRRSKQRVLLAADDESLVLFGCGGESLYIESFSRKDGSRKFRFCTDN